MRKKPYFSVLLWTTLSLSGYCAGSGADVDIEGLGCLFFAGGKDDLVTVRHVVGAVFYRSLQSELTFSNEGLAFNKELQLFREECEACRQVSFQ